MKKLVLLLPILLLPAIVAAAEVEYAYTTAYFNIPLDASFEITLLGVSAVESAESAPGIATTWISFNFTSVPEYWVEPQTEGQTANKQNGITQPIFRYRNIGNIEIDIYLNASSPGPNTAICANASCDGTCVSATTACTDIVNQPTWVRMVDELAVNSYLNVTLYGNVTTGATGGQLEFTIYHRSDTN